MHEFNWISQKFIITTILLSFSGINESSAQTTDCHFTLKEENGTFQTPGFPAKYKNNMECIWNIKVQPGRFVLLSFDVFEVESYRGSCIDIVEVKDGGTSTDQLIGSFCDTSLPPSVITSSTNKLRIWFYSDSTKAYQGFNASYTSQLEKGCGGSLTKTTGSISSPRFPNYPYPNLMQCDWIITVPSGKFIRIEFSDFEVEFNCLKECQCMDYLEIWDGPAFNEIKLGSFCVSIQPLIVTQSNRMRLRFKTNEEGRFKGFRLSYTTSLTPGCGGDFFGESGVITSPNYPMSFPAFSDCVWRIKAPADRYISLRFVEFTGINGTNSACSVGSIEVKEGFSWTAQTLERYCQQNVPTVIVTKGHELYIHFKAQSGEKTNSSLDRRFKGIYLTHSRGCKESIGLQDGRVRNSQLSASSFLTLNLGHGRFYMRSQYGRVGSDYSWCSQIQFLNKIDDEYLQIDLVNLTEITALATQGYQLRSTTMVYWGYVTRYRLEYSYEGNHWIRYKDNKQNSTSLGFTEFSGNTDYAEIKKTVFTPSIIAVRIRIFPTGFRSNPVKHMCLRAELYGCTQDLGCGSMISLKKSGEIQVRGSHQQSKHCTWFSIPSAEDSSNDILSFHFTYFDVPCLHGQVTLYDRNGGKKKTFCGADPPPVTSLPTTSQISLEIKLERGSDVWGFDLKYKTESLGCGTIIQVLSSNILTSPGYPFPYQHNQHCAWILTTHPGSKITVTFLECDLQPAIGMECQDFVQIQDGRLDTSPVLEKLCGKHVPVKVTSTINNLRIKFHSDNTTTAKGFVLQYSVIPRKYRPTSHQFISSQTYRTTSRHSMKQTENKEGSASLPSHQESRRDVGHPIHASSFLISTMLLCLLLRFSITCGLWGSRAN